MISFYCPNISLTAPHQPTIQFIQANHPNTRERVIVILILSAKTHFQTIFVMPLHRFAYDVVASLRTR